MENNNKEKLCSIPMAQVIGKIFSPFSLNFQNWAIKNLKHEDASPLVKKLINKRLNPNDYHFTHTQRLYEECRAELEKLGFTEEMKVKYSPFNMV